MPQLIKVIIVITLLIAGLFSMKSVLDDSVDVTFVLQSPDLAETETVYIAGNHEKLGSWAPDKVALKYAGDHQWKTTLSFPKAEILEYKFTLGSWDREGADARGRSLQNNNFKPLADGIAKTEIFYWRDGTPAEILGQITGQVKYHAAMKGEGLKDRDMVVWLPPEYDDNRDVRYPVLYMHDGQNVFDPNTASFQVDWEVDETADRLIRGGEIEPMIIVGLNSTVDRSDDYDPTKPKGQAYMKFLAEVVKPFIDATYRTKVGREHTAVGGSSMGGIISLGIVWEYSHVFSKAIAMSPAFKVGDIDYVRVVENTKRPEGPIKLYIDNGTVGLEEKLQPGIDDMLEALKAKGLVEGQDYWWIQAEGDTHFEAAWAKRMPQAMKLLY